MCVCEYVELGNKKIHINQLCCCLLVRHKMARATYKNNSVFNDKIKKKFFNIDVFFSPSFQYRCVF